jgi:hypothetical protein
MEDLGSAFVQHWEGLELKVWGIARTGSFRDMSLNIYRRYCEQAL